MTFKTFAWRVLATIVSQPAVANWLIARAKKTPYSHISSQDGSTVYMYRYWLFNHYSEDHGRKEGLGSELDNRRWPSLPSIRVHHIMTKDRDRDLHDHPWDARTIVLRGYYEEIRQETCRILDNSQRSWCGRLGAFVRGRGYTGPLVFGQYHRITDVSEEGVYTLFFTWKYQGTWGFLVNGKKVPWREYLGIKPAAQSEGQPS